MARKRKSPLILIMAVVALAFVSVLAVIAYVQYRRDPGQQLRARIRAARAAGRPVTLAEWAEERGEGVENPSLWVQAARALPPGLGTRSEGDSVEGMADAEHMVRDLIWGPFDEPGRPLAEETRRIMESFVADRSKAIDLAGRAAAAADARPVPMVVSEDGTIENETDMGDVSELVHVLVLKARQHAMAGEREQAEETIRTIAAMRRIFSRPLLPVEVSQASQVASLVMRTIADAVNLCGLSPEFLAEMQDLAREADESVNFGDAFAGQRGFEIGAIVPKPDAFLDASSFDIQDSVALDVLGHVLRSVDAAERIASLPLEERLAYDGGFNDRIGEVRAITLVHKLAGAEDLMTDLIDTEGNAHLNWRMAATVAALERYRMATGAWPESLESLVPDYLDAVPETPFGGGMALGYDIEEGKGVVVYNAGNESLVTRDGYGAPAVWLADPERRNAEPLPFREEVVDIDDWLPVHRGRALYQLGFTRERLGELGFTTDDLGGWEPEMEKPL